MIVCPHTPLGAPTILPGVLGCIEFTVLQRGADTIPQIEVAVTQTFPMLKLDPTLVVMDGVPAPEVIVRLAGTVHV